MSILASLLVSILYFRLSPLGEPTADQGLGGGADEKVIVRSNGTVTYVGKDIAYQLWKLGVLGLEETPITWERAVGVALLLAGTYLIVR